MLMFTITQMQITNAEKRVVPAPLSSNCTVSGLPPCFKTVAVMFSPITGWFPLVTSQNISMRRSASLASTWWRTSMGSSLLYGECLDLMVTDML